MNFTADALLPRNGLRVLEVMTPVLLFREEKLREHISTLHISVLYNFPEFSRLPAEKGDKHESDRILKKRGGGG